VAFRKNVTKLSLFPITALSQIERKSYMVEIEAV
jgi:hypothetical protein